MGKKVNKGGRPTKYNPEVLQKTREYISRIKEEKDIPFVEQLAVELQVHRDTLYEWSDKHREFSDTLKEIEDMQLYALKKGSLLNKYNPASAIFQMKANHGMVETSRNELTGADGDKLETVVVYLPEKGE